MSRAKCLVAACLMAVPATAQTCPPVPDHSARLQSLMAEAREAPDQQAGMTVSNRMWALWADAPDARAQELLDEGMERRQSYDYGGAMTAFEALVDYCPDYAEGYNQRAFIAYLRGEYEAALPDLNRALVLQPSHVAALTGKALTLVALGRNGEAALALRAALDMNPWLSERALLPVLEQGEDTL